MIMRSIQFARGINTLIGLALISCILACSTPCPPEPESQVEAGMALIKPGVNIKYVIFRTDQGSLFICFPDVGETPRQLSGLRGSVIRPDGSRDILVSGEQEEGKGVVKVTTETESGGRFEDTFDEKGNLIKSEQLK